MRLLILAALLCAATPALADPCDRLATRIASTTGIAVAEHEEDFVSYQADPDITVTLACSAGAASSAGVHHRGEEPPDAYYRLFGEVGEAVTGIGAGRITAAARRARADAPRRRHGNVLTDGLLVTCTVSRPQAGAPLTMCAVIAQSDGI